MAMHALLLSGLVLMAQSTAVPPSVVLSCKMPAKAVAGGAPIAPTNRLFRVTRGVFQEWDPIQKKFGNNLCGAYSCSVTSDRLEGSIASASVVYTVGILSGTNEGYWRAVGASGLTENKGPCVVLRAPAAAPKPKA